jgi:hypothetical protein
MKTTSLRFNRLYDFARIRFGQMLNEVRFPSRRTENDFRTEYVRAPTIDGRWSPQICVPHQIIKNQSSSIGSARLRTSPKNCFHHG